MAFPEVLKDILFAYRSKGASCGFHLGDELFTLKISRLQRVAQCAYLTFGTTQSVEQFFMVGWCVFFGIHNDKSCRVVGKHFTEYTPLGYIGKQ